MRKKFIEIIYNKMKTNKKIFLIVGDLGFNLVEPIYKSYPKNFLNVGIAEQNMAGIAAGIASEGYHVFIYSIANFPTFRCAEQIRNDIDYHNLNVTIVSAGAGLSYGSLGYSHHALQDYALMRSFPNMEIISPGDDNELQDGLSYSFKNPGPKYLRLEKDNKKIFNYKCKKKYKFGGLRNIKFKSIDKAIITTGPCIQKAVDLSYKKKFKEFSIYSLPIWSMKSKKKIKKQISKFKKILTIEKHLEDGGFSSWMREVNGANTNIQISSMSLSSKVIGKVGSQDFLENQYYKIR